LAGVLPAKFVKGGRGFSTAHPWAVEKQAGIRAGFPAGWSAHPSPPPGGPRKAGAHPCAAAPACVGVAWFALVLV